MNKIFLSIMLILISTFSNGQDSISTIKIDYGLFKTTYLINEIEVNKKEFKKILEVNETSYKQFRQGRTLMTTGNIIATPSIILLLVTIENQNNGNAPYAWQWIGGIGGSLLGTVLYFSGQKKTIEGVNLFNESQKLSLELNTKNCIGLTFRF